MARILIGTFPAVGHINPFFPLVRALALRGQEIVWTNSAIDRERIEAAGTRFVPFAQAHDFATLQPNQRSADQQQLTSVAALKADLMVRADTQRVPRRASPIRSYGLM